MNRKLVSRVFNIFIIVTIIVISQNAFAAPPVAPSLTVATSGTTVQINWSSVDNSTGYILFYCPCPYTGIEPIGSIDIGLQLGLSGDLPLGSSFYVAVQSYNSEGQSGFSNIGQFSISSPVGFKGLNLSMTNDQVNELVANTPWGYDAFYGQEDSPQYGNTAFLEGDNSTEGWTWAKIGCEGPDGSGSCYWISSVFIRYYNNMVVDIVLSSPGWSANKIETSVKGWGKFALNGLSEKYGTPSTIYQTFDQVDILSFRSGFYTDLYQWDLNYGQERIILSISEYNYEYSCAIRYQDVAGVNALEQESHQYETEF